ncbi:MAG: hypothetical protein ACKPKO_62335, partial [Candidatus Fonsibacter sp.]
MVCLRLTFKFEHIYIYIMRVLELFSGTGSVGNVCKALGMDVVSLDRDMPADIRTDIMDWDYKTYSPYDVEVMRAIGLVVPVHYIRLNVCRHVPIQRHYVHTK